MPLIRILSAMAGIHSVPDHDYLKHCPADTVRVAFDQSGTIYPRDAAAPLPRPQRIGHNYALNIDAHLRRAGLEYGPAEILAAVQSASDEIARKAMSLKASHVTVLIHGYNNGYAAASENYRALRSRLSELIPGPTVYLEVFWDGLCRGPITFPAPLMYWFDALTYSNLAGQIGLRSLMNRLPKSLSIFICTHSRGAGVAFSALADPIYDRGILVPKFEPSQIHDFRSIALVCLAPAVGNGHALVAVQQRLPSRSSLGIGFNRLDPALGKSLAKTSWFGDTSLGADERYFNETSAAVNRGTDWLYRSVYEDNPSHDLSRYVQHAEGKPFNALIRRAWNTLAPSTPIATA